MVENSITIKAETVEEAVQTALNILQCTMGEVNVEVLKPASKSLFGLKKQLAEVTITRIDRSNILLNNETSEELESLIEDVYNARIVEDSENEVNISLLPKKKSTTLATEPIFGAWIQNNEVYIQETDQRLPMIEADEKVKVFVNGERLLKPQLVTRKDKVVVELEDEIVPGHFKIEIKDNNMMAILTIASGKKIIRNLEDTDPEENLTIRAKEIIFPFMDISLEDIIQNLKSLKIEKGILLQSIQQLLKTEEGEGIIAKGLPPVEGLNGDIDVLVEGWQEQQMEEEINPLDKVDYRERQPILSVEVGEVIAKKVIAVPGKQGQDLFGKVIEPKQVYDVVLKLGENVEQKGNQIMALTSGRPFIEKRGKLVKINVIKEHLHAKDVNLESGNIRFPGDVRIIGNVLDAMVVEAEGSVYIQGTVNRAIVRSNHSMKIEQNVFSSSLIVGEVNHVIVSLTKLLSELLAYLDHILAAINQILMIRRQNNPKDESVQISYLIRLLLEKKYSDFRDLVNKFCKMIEENEQDLDKEWKSLSLKLKEVFITVSRDRNFQLQAVDELAEWMREMYENYFRPPEPKVSLELPYGINTSLYSSGNINVIGQGVYHCNLRADYNVIVKGVCRGGSISAGNAAFLDEVGSKNGGKTTIVVPTHGKIYIKYAHIDTVIQIGRRMHTFKKGTTNIAAFLDEEGNLQIYK